LFHLVRESESSSSSSSDEEINFQRLYTPLGLAMPNVPSEKKKNGDVRSL
jgi:hypothetical protein